MVHLKHSILAGGLVLILLGLTLACSSDYLIFGYTPPTPTATIIVARFMTATPTATPLPTATPPPATEAPPSPTLEAVSPTATPEAEREPVSQSPLATPTSTVSPTPAASPTPTSPPPSPTATPSPTLTPTPAPLAGRIAFPIDNGGGRYDVWVFEPPDGQPFLVQQGARQPNFSVAGELLINNENNQYGENLGWLGANYAWQGLVSDSPHDSHPFWSPDGSRYVFSNPQLLLDPNTNEPLPHVFIPCSMRRPSVEEEVKCRDIGTGGKVAIGQYPVWTDDDRIVYFSFDGNDGLYVVDGASNLWQAGGVGQRQLLIESNGMPTDTRGFQVFFQAGSLDQNWEAYVIDLDGSNLRNLSNSPTSQDGLPTVSPDGSWVAFVSDRDGPWGIWVVPITGGEPTKLLDFTTINTNPNPWGTGDRHWTLERMSWGEGRQGG